MAVIRTENVGKVLRARAILRDVSLSVAAGEIVALSGPSGCGKTTLLRILAGLDPAFTGAVTHGPGVRLGMVFQEPRLLPWRTLRQNFAFVRPTADAAAMAVELGLGGAMDAYPRQLSLGMARRAAVVRALSVRPGLLLLDEPFASLDAAAAETTRLLILRRWREERFAVVLVSHDPADIRAMAQRELTLTGTPATLAR